MHRARALWRRCWPTGYIGLCGFEIVSAWLSVWPPDVKIDITLLTAAMAMMFGLWRIERRRRQRAEQLADRARKQGMEPCGTCLHFACDGEECWSCDGPCRSPRPTRPMDNRAYWLN